MGHQITSYTVAHTFQKRKLLIAINCIAGLSIFFFGYDQGMMGGVNNAKDYIQIMGFGYVDGTNTPVVTDSLLQGGIVSVYYLGTLVGALLGGLAGERFGRIKTIAIGAAWGVLGASLQCSAQNHIWMIFGQCKDIKHGQGADRNSSTHKWLWYRHLECNCSGLGH
jgi:MFS family permease